MVEKRGEIQGTVACVLKSVRYKQRIGKKGAGKKNEGEGGRWGI